jgi:hypothetical protein
MAPSFPYLLGSSGLQMVMVASHHFPITPPAVGAHQHTGSMPSCWEVMRCRLPNSALEDVCASCGRYAEPAEKSAEERG